ncbi:enoyl-CoA hydratase-related protein [Mycolicibacterium fluoranthenivorans]|uniref:2-(1,2-epoxy-1,2-dihydrophenyl)acetyl-CoA isomerase n=1 Tax=Mycolicibacterium fluoranthenivorans TaxID=258505 RepID=A0A7X5ZEZ8_9MYCO|nr:enoyl-CoA hydratase-related protein [Mycolicibacterium fluoranthenivorans]MCV7358553.1 enoyl-CoA hydratase/isomerase family protein [Mycolicibacterium fluoranthenivorans]NIH97615.1 2-(1,2-epoxy-1,2-dihydrophenyl)acetyl-CoA isomerase [Mycolicibacterium fluoranthenivorans]
MSVELTRDTKVATAERLYQALAKGDVDALNQLLAADFVGHAAQGLPLGMGGTHVGPDAMRAKLWWRIGEHFKARAVAEDFQTLEDGRLVVTGTYRGSARRSGGELEAAFVHILSFDGDGRIVSLNQLTDTAAWHAALEGDGRLQTIDFRVEDGVATICLNRPAQRNAINLRMAQEFLEVARRIAADPSVRAVLISGSGPALTVGGDISYFLEGGGEGYDRLFERMIWPFHEAFDILSRIEAPIVAAAHGAVAGGGMGFVYAADLVIAATGTRFVPAFAAIGLSGDGGGTYHLPRLIGPRRAAQAYLRNTPISVEEALEWGLVNEIVPADELHARAAALARELAEGPTVAFATMRALLRESWGNDLTGQLAAELRGTKKTGITRDAAGAFTAFAEKRTPTFEGR